MGEFADEEGHQYIVLVNRNLVSGVIVSINLVDKFSKIEQMSPYSGEMRPFENGESLAPGAGVLLAIK